MSTILQPSLLLASSSPRRVELLAQLGICVESMSPDIDESVLPDEAPRDYILRLAVAKAHAIDIADRVILAADTTLVLNGQIIGKPTDRADALATLAKLSGRSHQVLTAVALRSGNSCQTRVVETNVWLRAMNEQEMLGYWESGEPEGKAGSYAIQGLGAIFVERLDGSYSNVVGLPLFETAELLSQFGIAPSGFAGLVTRPL